jgi:hypothetical protein
MGMVAENSIISCVKSENVIGWASVSEKISKTHESTGDMEMKFKKETHSFL